MSFLDDPLAPRNDREWALVTLVLDAIDDGQRDHVQRLCNLHFRTMTYIHQFDKEKDEYESV